MFERRRLLLRLTVRLYFLWCFSCIYTTSDSTAARGEGTLKVQQTHLLGIPTHGMRGPSMGNSTVIMKLGAITATIVQKYEKGAIIALKQLQTKFGFFP